MLEFSRKKEGCRRRRKRAAIVGFLLVLGTVYLVFGQLFGIAVVDGVSMEPTLSSGEVLFFSRIDKGIAAGDIVIFQTGYGVMIKRVVAVEGDTVEVDQDAKTLLVNGSKVKEWGEGNTDPMEDSVSYPLKVGKEQLYVLGDNREAALDSRKYGVVSYQNIIGKVISKVN